MIIGANGGIGDAGNSAEQISAEPGLLLGRLPRPLRKRCLPEHVRKRYGAFEHAREGGRAALPEEGVGILALGQEGEFQRVVGTEQGQNAIHRAFGGALAGSIAIEAKDRCARAPSSR